MDGGVNDSVKESSINNTKDGQISDRQKTKVILPHVIGKKDPIIKIRDVSNTIRKSTSVGPNHFCLRRKPNLHSRNVRTLTGKYESQIKRPEAKAVQCKVPNLSMERNDSIQKETSFDSLLQPSSSVDLPNNPLPLSEVNGLSKSSEFNNNIPMAILALASPETALILVSNVMKENEELRNEVESCHELIASFLDESKINQLKEKQQSIGPSLNDQDPHLAVSKAPNSALDIKRKSHKFQCEPSYTSLVATSAPLSSNGSSALDLAPKPSLENVGISHPFQGESSHTSSNASSTSKSTGYTMATLESASNPTLALATRTVYKFQGAPSRTPLDGSSTKPKDVSDVSQPKDIVNQLDIDHSHTSMTPLFASSWRKATSKCLARMDSEPKLASKVKTSFGPSVATSAPKSTMESLERPSSKEMRRPIQFQDDPSSRLLVLAPKSMRIQFGQLNQFENVKDDLIHQTKNSGYLWKCNFCTDSFASKSEFEDHCMITHHFEIVLDYET